MSVPVLVVLVAGLLVLVAVSILCICLKRQQLKRTADTEKNVGEGNKADDQQNSIRYLVRVLDERRGSRNSLSGTVEEQPRAPTPTRGASEDSGRQNVLLQRQVSVRTSDFPHSPNDTQSNVEVEKPAQQRSSQVASVDVHHEQEHVSSSFRGAAPRARIRHNSAGSSSSRGSVRSAGGSIRRERRVLASPPSSPRDSPVESPRRRRTVAETSRTSTEQPMGLDVVLEWEPPQRAPSTDWTPLETSLDFWRHEHSRQPPLPDEDEHEHSKVRYNDTGSLEEVNVEEMVEYYIEDEEINTSDGASLRLQYRQLWELRATLEDEEFDDTTEEPAPTATQHSRSSLEQSPEPDAGTSHTTSFESNTEPLLGDDTVRWPPHLLQLPSYESRRQTYKNILASRLRRMQDVRAGGTQQKQQENNSFDSIETVDTEGSSTDASRLEQVTTSFESTTDNTDSTGDSQAHRLQQLRADSGYRSFETPAGRAPKLHKRVPVLDSGELEELVTPSEVEDEGIGNASPPPAVHTTTRSASKKRREFGRERDSKCITEIETDSRSGNESHEDVVGSTTPNTVATLVTTSTGGRTTKTVVLPRYLRHGGRYNSVYSLPQRDFSVDEKSDALFREFSRCDPMLEPVEGRQRFHYRRLQQARSSLDLEMVHHKTRLHDEQLLQPNKSTDIPVIRVAHEDS